MKTVLFSVSLLVGIFSQNAFSTPPNPSHKVCICHNIKVEGKKPQCVDVASTSGAGHLGHTGPQVLDIITSQSCQNNNDCGANVCGNSVPQCETGYHFDNNLGCVKDDCGCSGEGCACTAHLEDHADFTFNIEAGGLDHSLYVCEIGFLAHSCPTGDCGGDYIQFGQTRATVGTPILLTKAQTLKSGSANVYLNSLNSGSKFYVRYCLDVERKVVGTPTNGKIAGLLASDLKLTAGNDTNYFTYSGLNAEVFHECSATRPLTSAVVNTNSFGSFAVKSTLNETVEASDCLKFGTTSTTKFCSWVVVYSETNKCLRQLYKNLDQTASTRSGMVRSDLDFDLDFNCGENCQ